MEAIQKWRQYLRGREFIIRSDQKSLKDLLQQVVQTPDQHFYVRKLMGYKFTIEYKKGSMNKAADALSRREEPLASCAVLDATADDATVVSASLSTLSQPFPDFLDELKAEITTLPDLVDLVQRITAGTAPPHVSMVGGLLYYDRRLFLSSASTLKSRLLHEHHSTPMAGHPGWERTFRLLSAGFYWSTMRKDVRKFVEACETCQATKYSTQKPAGLLQPLPIPSQVWEDVSMDFIVGLPQSRGYTVIMVVVDRLSKYAHFVPLPTHFDALRVAQLFITTVVRHHGFPKTLVSDRDSVFLNATWEEMLRLSGTKLQFLTAYHPQSDGQTEVRNRGLEQYLRAFAADKPSTWGNLLPWAELALNCFYHAGIGMSPYQALYGRVPPMLVAVSPSPRTPPKVADLIVQRGKLLELLWTNLERAQQRMREAANKHRRHVDFEVGDLVWLKLQPYRQHSVAKPLSAKLSRRFYGPYAVLERIGPVAYRLQLPDGSRIHNVFHVSLLKEFVAGDKYEQAVLPKDFRGLQPVVRPLGVLDSRMVWREGALMEHLLVSWSDSSPP